MGVVEWGLEVLMVAKLWKISIFFLMKGDFLEGWRINIWAEVLVWRKGIEVNERSILLELVKGLGF